MFKDGYIGLVKVLPLETGAAGGSLLNLNSPPVFHASETIPLVSGAANDESAVKFDLTGISIKSGKIIRAIFYYKRNGVEDDGSISTYHVLNEFTVTQDSPTELSFTSPIKLYNKPSVYDFKVILCGLSGEEGASVETVNVVFNGFYDLLEYYEVDQLKVVNSQDGDSETGILSDYYAQLTWRDPRVRPSNTFPVYSRNGFNGKEDGLSLKQIQLVTGFVIYMYVTDTEDDYPVLNHPGPYNINELVENPSWYYVGESAVPNFAVRCPTNKYVAFWVGMKSAHTDTTKYYKKSDITLTKEEFKN